MGDFRSNLPLGTDDAEVFLKGNVPNLDEAVNTRSAESWNDRFGVARKTWWGMEQDFQQFLINSGYQNIGDYGPGLEITARNQIFWRDGELYRAGAVLELPYTTTGDWGAEEGLFVAVGDASLRQELSGSIGEGTGALIVNGSVAYVNSVSELRELTPKFHGQLIQTRGHTIAGLGGGLFFYDDSSSDADDNGLVIVTTSGARWVRIDTYNVTPEMFGALGDGINYDTQGVKSWWESNSKSLEAKGTYLIDGTKTFRKEVKKEDFTVSMEGAEFRIDEKRAYLFDVNILEAGRNVSVKGGSVSGGDNVSRPLEISTIGVSAGSIKVDSFSAYDVFANSGLGYSSSAIGISIPSEASQITVTNCAVFKVNRDYVNPGIVGSVGISVTKVMGSAYITNNVVGNIGSPAGDADADGISVFSRDNLLVGRQQVKIEVSGNRLSDCKGRFIKLQTTKADIWGNSFESTSGELIESFRGIDCQFGGCTIRDNFWNLFAGVTGGAEANFVLTQFKNEGNWESQTVVRDNFIILERPLRYFVSATLHGGVSQIEVRNNYIKANQSTDFLNESLVRVDTESLANVQRCRVEVVGNTYPCDRDPIVQLVGDEFSGDSSAADKIQYHITDNRNTVPTPSNLYNAIIFVAATDPVPHLSDIVIRGNSTGGDHRINAKTLSINSLPNGNDFFYGTDGGSGGIGGAPSGFDRFVRVRTGGGEVELRTGGGATAFKVDGGSWRSISSTAM